ncbi:MAG: precorrin-6y C5,15-methyltransferase (decarboxylating) subunit CbiE [Silicimonas sp.]|nr:precorrin-6y C5,15-methyltransferase (decarboxylating) subunit CbiE [Silicimonas sp.]
MDRACWLTIIGLGEDGPAGLTSASLDALACAEVVMGPERHLTLIPESAAERITWPVPFADGLTKLETLRGRNTVVLASGDPFWFGAGSVIARQFAPSEWRALPGPSVFSLAAARLGWPLETTTCLGLHAAPFERLRPHLAGGTRAILTLRDGPAVGELARYLSSLGFGTSPMLVMEALGGPREKTRETTPDSLDFDDIQHPVAVALTFKGATPLTKASGQPDDIFQSDGQITKRPIRALTLSALAPKPGETLWDIGAGSGSIAVEWLMSDPTTQAVAIETRPDRLPNIRANARALGQDRLQVVEGRAPSALENLSEPDAVFIGGGLNRDLLDWLWTRLAPGTRIVANAVTLDTEALLVDAQAEHGGHLLRVELAEAQPLGRFRGWKAAYPLVQWSVTR